MKPSHVLAALVVWSSCKGNEPNDFLDLSADYDEYSVWDNLTGPVATFLGVNTGSFTTPVDWVTVPPNSSPGTFSPMNEGADPLWGQFGKVPTIPVGGGYFAGLGIYTANTPTTFFIEKQETALNVENVVFQISSFSLEGPSDILLKFNYSEEWIEPQVYSLGSVTGDSGGFSGTTYYIGYQWDLSDVPEEVTSYEVRWTSGVHTSITEFRLASADGPFLPLIPPVVEPELELSVAAPTSPQTPTGMTFEYSSAFEGMVRLESTDVLGDNAVWTEVVAAHETVGEVCQIQVPREGARRFYRLAMADDNS